MSTPNRSPGLWDHEAGITLGQAGHRPRQGSKEDVISHEPDDALLPDDILISPRPSTSTRENVGDNQGTSELGGIGPGDSPLRNTRSPFWGVHINDEGTGRKDGFHALLSQGQISLVTPNRAQGYGSDGKSIMLRDGRALKANAVILATGFSSSWTGIFTGEPVKSSRCQCSRLLQRKLSKSSE